VNEMSKRLKANKARVIRTIGTRFGIYILIALGVLFSASAAHANNIYVAQSSVGGGNGADCANARAIGSLGGGDWSAGNTIHLCGTVASTLTAQGSGSSGSPITVFFEPGSGISVPALSANGQIDVSNRSWIVIDGGGGSCGFVGFANVTCSQGYIQSTANGSSLANHINSVAILADGSSNVEIKGLRISNVYVHSSTSDSSTSRTYCVRAYSFPANLSIHNNTMHDVGWCLDGGGSGLKFYANEVYHMDHGVGTGGPVSNISVYGNHFHDMANWDTTSDSYHHDGVHIFTDNGAVSGVMEYNNLFDGDTGNNVTAWVYDEASVGSFTGLVEFNNVAYEASGRNSCCGVMGLYSDGGSGSGNIFVNNTIIGPGFTPGTGSGSIVKSGQQNATYKNNFLACCQNEIGVDSGASFASGGLSNNVYEDVAADYGGGGSTFNWKGNFTNSFSTWVSSSGETGARFGTLSAIIANGTTGVPGSGSMLCGAGANLTSLGIAALNVDIRGNPRPSSGAWDSGAFNCNGNPVSQSPPSPPTNIRAVVQ
jgi:hypothetical protein